MIAIVEHMTLYQVITIEVFSCHERATFVIDPPCIIDFCAVNKVGEASTYNITLS